MKYTHTLAQVEHLLKRIHALSAENRKLRSTLRDALDFADEGWRYASPYFREKWQCEERLAELREALASHDPGAGRE